jgi:hypothetical protein
VPGMAQLPIAHECVVIGIESRLGPSGSNGFRGELHAKHVICLVLSTIGAGEAKQLIGWASEVAARTHQWSRH